MAPRIYVVEDDENIRDLLKIALGSYSYEVFEFETAEDALGRIEQDLPDLCIFDIMLPGMDGITAVKKIRAISGLFMIQIMMLTAKDTEVDKVIGLDSGADDYMTKPFGIMELMARIRALLRRSEVVKESLPKTGKVILSGDLSINPGTREVVKDCNIIPLTFKEFEILLYLLERNDRVVLREQLLRDIWGYDFVVETRTLDMHIRSLRQKLGDGGETYIKTVRGAGYRYCAPISQP